MRMKWAEETVRDWGYLLGMARVRAGQANACVPKRCLFSDHRLHPSAWTANRCPQ